MMNPAIDFSTIYPTLSHRGYASIPQLLSPEDCDGLRALYANDALYRTTINMQRYRFGLGEYKYFNYPLPPIIQSLREKFYEALVPLANQWMKLLSLPVTYPEKLEDFLSLCRGQNQVRPTPLILRYGAGGHNTLHQDLYGSVYFPFQLLIVLSQRNEEYEGGELVFTEQIPRAQSRAHVMQPNKGDGILFTTQFKPVRSTRGYYRAAMKHGVSEVTKGERYAMGIIFHDAT